MLGSLGVLRLVLPGATFLVGRSVQCKGRAIVLRCACIDGELKYYRVHIAYMVVLHRVLLLVRWDGRLRQNDDEFRSGVLFL